MCDSRAKLVLLMVLGVIAATPAQARDSLGMFSGWGAFRDARVPRCYAIAKAEPSTLAREQQPYVSIGTWPRRQLRGQVHFRLSRQIPPNSRLTLSIDRVRFQLIGGGADAWAPDRRADAAVVAAMRSAQWMTVSARDLRGRGFSNSYRLTGAATAMDAAAIGCARLR